MMAKQCEILVWFTKFEIILQIIFWTQAAIIPPPWANPKLNPCALQPRGWQLLYWPPDGKCYKIFQVGYPCLDDMELSPIATKSSNQQFSAECRCPPMKAQSAKNGKCYELYTIGPCDKGFYFAPDIYYNRNNTSKRQWGICNQLKTCSNPNEIYWPRNGQCYQRFSRGPCAKGQLLTINTINKIPQCNCNNHERDLREYRYIDGSCYQHFTKGPCNEIGHLFLPDRNCGCHSFLPHFHDETERCYEIGTIGPCGSGESYQLHPEYRRGMCQCKTGYIRYKNTTSCYRPYTQGPCHTDYILVNSTSCIPQPCKRGHLYYPQLKQCFRIGIRGPCPKGHVITFDFDTRPSIDGISYNGLCNCEKNKCSTSIDDTSNNYCDRSKGMIIYQNQCYKLYAQGPCPKGAWLAPKRQPKHDQLWQDHDINKDDGICECMPGYTKIVQIIMLNTTIVDCISPTVILADYLNKNYSSSNIIKL